jgi:DNA modification methylase
MGGGAYRRRYEPIIYGNFSGAFYGTPYSEDDVWEFDRTSKNDLHPTMKPVDLVANALNHGSRPGGSVLDLFMGSGTTIIAAEQTRRSAYGMELDPAYCDVIVKRWEDFTGNTAICFPSEAHFTEAQEAA